MVSRPGLYYSPSYTALTTCIAPQYLIMNLGISESFGAVQYDQLTFPSTMRVDYVRVYQDPHAVNVGCDPSDFPTAAYIEQYVSSRLFFA